MLSGFVIASAYGGRISNRRQATAFAVRRFGRVWPLHAVVLTGFVGVELLKLALATLGGLSTGSPPFDPEGYTSLHTLPGHYAMATALGLHHALTWNSPDWSISAEFWTYLLFAAVILALSAWRLAVFAAAAAFAAAICFKFSNRGMDLTYDLGALRCIYGFMLGTLVHAARQRFEFVKLPAATALELLALAGVVAFVSAAGRDTLSFAAPLVFAAVVYIFSFEQGLASRQLERPSLRALGDWSYAIYIVHALVWYVLAMEVSLLARHSGIEPWQVIKVDGMEQRTLVAGGPYLLDVFGILYLSIVVFLASLSKRFIEDPARRYFNRRADEIEAGGVRRDAVAREGPG